VNEGMEVKGWERGIGLTDIRLSMDCGLSEAMTRHVLMKRSTDGKFILKRNLVYVESCPHVSTP
jgi:hypothetical protein